MPTYTLRRTRTPRFRPVLPAPDPTIGRGSIAPPHRAGAAPGCHPEVVGW